MAKQPRYRTTRDLVIPAGTELLSPPTSSSRWGSDFDAPIGVDDDHTGYFSIEPSEGVEAGFLEPITE